MPGKYGSPEAGFLEDTPHIRDFLVEDDHEHRARFREVLFLLSLRHPFDLGFFSCLMDDVYGL